MALDAALTGAGLTAIAGLMAAIISKLRCRFLVDNHDEGLGWSLAAGFSEFRLPGAESKSIEVYPLEGDTLYIKKSN
jgi:hypothetical protein